MILLASYHRNSVCLNDNAIVALRDTNRREAHNIRLGAII